MTTEQRPGVTISGRLSPAYQQILTPEALDFVAELTRRFGAERSRLLALRKERQRAINDGAQLDFLPETATIRESDWRVAPIPPDLMDRRIEITGPVDRKMVINALNSGARVFMADFEDSCTPTWDNLLDGQINLRDALNRDIEYVGADERHYRLVESPAVLVVRPRGWHLPERNVTVDGQAVPGALFDFGLYCFHNAQRALDLGSGPYFYLPKLQCHLEARLWNDVFNYAQDRLGLERGTIKATVLIETLPAVFEMDEILYALREHVVGLNCGRWDYIFSYIKTFQNDPARVLPDRGQVTMNVHFLRSYSQLLIKTCHRRGAFAMGGMAAQIPIRTDVEANQAALDKVRADKEREAGDGHDGTWVAHPGLVPVALEVFDRHMPEQNQLQRLREDVQVSAADLLKAPDGTVTETGLRGNVSVGLQYLEAWLGGLGCVPLHDLMEDAATAEISRAQIWQWIKYPRGVLEDGRRVTVALFRQVLSEELEKIREEVGDTRYAGGHFELAAQLMDEICTGDEFIDFLTLVAYEHI